MTRTTTILQAEIDAIAAQKTQLDIIRTRIQQIKTSAERLDGANKAQAEDIYNKATTVYTFLLDDHTYREEHGGLTAFHTEEAKESARYIDATTALLFAEPGQKREEALTEFLTISNELSNHSSKTKQYLGAAMLALGVALVGTAVALGICLLVGVWPCVPVVISMGPFAPIQFCTTSIQAMYAALIGTLGLAIGLPTLLGGAGLIYRKRSEEHSKENTGKKMMSELHGSFFKSTADGQKEITSLALVTDATPMSTDNRF